MIERYDMIENGEGIVVGLSGGPDSICLLHSLYCLKDRYNIKLYSVHLNHMIRGEEALRDENFARDFSESYNIPFFCRRTDVLNYAKEKSLSSEEAGRLLRYELFEAVLRETGAKKIALAHNMNDQAETMLMRFLRGSGITGMGGIKPVRDNKYIRPILSLSREEVESYCRENSLRPVIDSTNKETIYTRNRIRLEVIPYIKKHFNPNIIESLFKVSEILRDDDEYLNIISAKELSLIKSNNGISRTGFTGLHTAVKRRVLRALIQSIKGDLTGIESKHIEECIAFLEESGTGKKISLPDNIECIIEYAYFKFDRVKDMTDYEYAVNLPGITRAYKEYIITAKVFDSNDRNFLDKQYVKYFDYDKINNGIFFRNRRNGDYMYPKGMTGCKKLKDIFIDKKIPKDMRKEIPLITLGNEVLWILNLRDTKNYKPGVDTRHILELTIERGGENG
jgi:tRNA(Ile)-lysidine synthase